MTTTATATAQVTVGRGVVAHEVRGQGRTTCGRRVNATLEAGHGRKTCKTCARRTAKPAAPAAPVAAPAPAMVSVLGRDLRVGMRMLEDDGMGGTSPLRVAGAVNRGTWVRLTVVDAWGTEMSQQCGPNDVFEVLAA
ncbi:hypothetical protein B4N89_27820 [Embleya scabrispora]|uniref:Uncharacterized protein n=1 Tax=Embleya scabrispora TaxID=159449 RepID=A0A1T3P5J6_9ACTN|nr:hypothetical protein [Embleya scabrispora]OPC84231.1 hypothetical protein B4N89_27820 [Embleya scabrispora]